MSQIVDYETETSWTVKVFVDLFLVIEFGFLGWEEMSPLRDNRTYKAR